MTRPRSSGFLLVASVLVPVVHDMTGVLDVCCEFLIAVENDTNVSQQTLTSMLLAE